LEFRAVQADTGAIGGSASNEFHVLADAGEDAIAFADGSDYAANVEMASAQAPTAERPPACAPLTRVDTPTQKTIAAVSAHLGVAATQCVKTLLVHGEHGLVALCLRGDHELNPIKASRQAELGGQCRLAEEAEVTAAGLVPGFIGPVGLPAGIPLVIDRDAAVLADFVCGGNAAGSHYRGANWQRDAQIERSADLRNVIEGDVAPDGHGHLHLVRGIEVGHIFQLGDKYSQAMDATVLDENGNPQPMLMGCYGIGVSRIVAAAIEQHYDDNGIVWPESMAPWRVAICVINPKKDAAVDAAASALYDELVARGIDTALDDRGLRPGTMFADIELIGIPHRVVISARGLESGTLEYRARKDSDSRQISADELFELLA
ncbi:MAG: proline--tRNA ligase, partial [Xanthomonadales bacterium]|nr:proline--tRNA ligase [Xanthomonadales bacterium]